ncbi:hypothetical protein D3218_07740 [Aureimonas flava]|uniref:Uncharacterized protein n=1 Tax=Aureimonas flava TaxID=2320271 RepID=A0A3A1WSL9_9HYPH|nr:hypothetical protein [Aureimonas flava]RIY01254.1 hypothetical protein D3218_07740 [Aureimonas flava]
MKRLLLGSASVVAVVFGLSGAANAQVVGGIDLGDLGVAIGDILTGVDVAALNGLDIGVLNGIGAQLPDNAGVGGIYLNTAVNVAPQLATNVNVALPLDVGADAALGGLVTALGLALSPNTGSAAVVIDTSGIADLVAAIAGGIDVGDQTVTAVGVLANQGIQNATTTVAALADTSTLDVVGGTFDATDEATQAAASAGTAASSAAARYASVSIVNPNVTINNNIVDGSTDGALAGVYAANTALNVAPQIAANLNVASNIAAGVQTATAVGVLANQSISVGLDGGALTGALTGNIAGAVTGGGDN